MRVCAKHREPATETLKSYKTGTEYDLCPVCEAELEEILNGFPLSDSEFIEKGKGKIIEALEEVEKKKRGRKRT